MFRKHFVNFFLPKKAWRNFWKTHIKNNVRENFSKITKTNTFVNTLGMKPTLQPVGTDPAFYNTIK